MPAIAAATIQDLEAHPGRCELIHGEIIELSPVGPFHGYITTFIANALTPYAATHRGAVLSGDVGFIWSSDTVRAPDVAYLDEAGRLAMPRRGFMPLPPVLAVEVVSPTDHWTDVRRKVRGWLEYGAAMVWVVDPEDETVEIHQPGMPVQELTSTGTIGGGGALPGLVIPVKSLFG